LFKDFSTALQPRLLSTASTAFQPSLEMSDVTANFAHICIIAIWFILKNCNHAIWCGWVVRCGDWESQMVSCCS